MSDDNALEVREVGPGVDGLEQQRVKDAVERVYAAEGNGTDRVAVIRVPQGEESRALGLAA